MVAGVVPLFAFASTVPTLHVQMSPFFAVKLLSSCVTSMVPWVHSQIMGFCILALVLAPGSYVISRSRTLGTAGNCQAKILLTAESNQPKVWNVSKIFRVQRPEGGTVRKGAGRYGQVELPASRPSHRSIQGGCDLGLAHAKWHGCGSREEGLLSLNLFRESRAAKPLIQRKRT